MRVAFLVLLLANVILLLWGQGYLGTRQEGREPGRIAQQLAAEKLRIVPAGVTQPATPATESAAQ